MPTIPRVDECRVYFYSHDPASPILVMARSKHVSGPPAAAHAGIGGSDDPRDMPEDMAGP